MRIHLLLLAAVLTLASPVLLAAPNENTSTSAQTADLQRQLDAANKDHADLLQQVENEHNEVLRAAQKIRVLRRQVIALGSALTLLLAGLVLRRFYRLRRLRILAMTDELTRLPNREHILTFLGDQARQAYEEEQPISIIAFDIDYFRKVADEHGREAADTVLKAIAGISNRALRRGDRIGRIGSGKFLVVLPGTERNSAAEIAERLRRSIEVSEVSKFVASLRMTISLGVAEWNAGRESVDALIKRADSALEEAENLGRNRVVEK